MPTFKNSRGKWCYRVMMRYPDGRRQRIFGVPMANTQKAAEKAERAHIERLLNPEAPAPVETPTFAEFAAEWLKNYPASVDNRPSTIAAHIQHVHAHLLPRLGSLRLDQIDARAVVRVFAELKETKKAKPGLPGRDPKDDREAAKCLSATTIRNIGQTLHKILVCAQQWGKLPQGVPAWPKRKTSHVPWDFYTAEESAKLLAAAKGDEYVLLLFALRTGARQSEQIALEWGDLDFANHKVYLRRNLHKGVEGPTKTGRGRVVPMSPVLEEALRGLRHLKGDKVFCKDDGEPWDFWHLVNTLEWVQHRAGLRRVRWHDLRHSFASQAIIAGVNIRQVQEWLGHASIVMTMRYAHLAPNSNEVALVSALDRAGVCA